jgi:DNA-binding MarR family transcriptional regulator
MVSSKILKILSERREISLRELIDEVEEHPGVVKQIIKQLEKEGKISIKKQYRPHKPTKYEIILEATL